MNMCFLYLPLEACNLFGLFLPDQITVWTKDVLEHVAASAKGKGTGIRRVESGGNAFYVPRKRSEITDGEHSAQRSLDRVKILHFTGAWIACDQYCGIVIPYHGGELFAGNFPKVVLDQVFRNKMKLVPGSGGLILIAFFGDGVAGEVKLSVKIDHIGDTVIDAVLAVREGACNVACVIHDQDIGLFGCVIIVKHYGVAITKELCHFDPAVADLDFFGVVLSGFSRTASQCSNL